MDFAICSHSREWETSSYGQRNRYYFSIGISKVNFLQVFFYSLLCDNTQTSKTPPSVEFLSIVNSRIEVAIFKVSEGDIKFCVVFVCEVHRACGESFSNLPIDDQNYLLIDNHDNGFSMFI